MSGSESAPSANGNWARLARRVLHFVDVRLQQFGAPRAIAHYGETFVPPRQEGIPDTVFTEDHPDWPDIARLKIAQSAGDVITELYKHQLPRES